MKHFEERAGESDHIKKRPDRQRQSQDADASQPTQANQPVHTVGQLCVDNRTQRIRQKAGRVHGLRSRRQAHCHFTLFTQVSVDGGQKHFGIDGFLQEGLYGQIVLVRRKTQRCGAVDGGQHDDGCFGEFAVL